jgi:hypothetical protein
MINQSASAAGDQLLQRREFPGVDRKARLQLPFPGLPVRPVEERMHDFNEVLVPFTPEQAAAEAARCLHCPDPAP